MPLGNHSEIPVALPSRAASLLEVARALAHAYTEAQIAAIVVGKIFDAAGAAFASVYFISDGIARLASSRGADTAAPAEVSLDARLPIAHCMRNGENIFIETHDALAKAYPDASATSSVSTQKRQALVCVPLRSGEQVVGAIAVTFDRARTFDEDERAFFLTIKNHASVAVERSRLLAAERAAARHLQIIAQASRRFAESLRQPDAISDTVAEEVARGLSCSCAVNLVSPNGEMVSLVAVHDPDPARLESIRTTLERAPARLDEESLLTRVVRTGQSVFMRNVDMKALMAATSRAEYRAHFEQYPIRSLCVVPLRAAGIVLGTLTVSTSRDASAMTDDDETMLLELADRAALAIENATLYEKARRAVADREEMLAVVSHDLRNPLANLTLNIDMLARHFDDAEPPRMLASMRRAAERMHSLIRNLMEVARIDAGRLTIEPETVRARALVEETIAVQETLAIEQSLSLAAEVPDDTCNVRCGRELILQVLANLVANAIKFTPAGGHVKVSARRTEDGKEVVLSVSDTGCGIAPEELPHVFDRYWQARQRKGAGVGLGLAIAAGIVSAHGGRIWVESTVGAGSTFSFCLPAA
jgi:signal transduction histidine kinase